jgi:hypothetical protein
LGFPTGKPESWKWRGLFEGGVGGYIAIIGELEYKPYTHVLFINGYRKDSPRIKKEIESITIGKPKKGMCHDEWLDTEFFVIKFK